MSHTYNNASYVLFKDIAPTSAQEVLVSGSGFDIFGHCCGCRNEASGCCWMCDVTPGRVDEVSRESSWLQPAHRKSPWQALLAAPKVSPLFSAVFVGVDSGLHIAGLAPRCRDRRCPAVCGLSFQSFHDQVSGKR